MSWKGSLPAGEDLVNNSLCIIKDGNKILRIESINDLCLYKTVFVSNLFPLTNWIDGKKEDIIIPKDTMVRYKRVGLVEIWEGD